MIQLNPPSSHMKAVVLLACLISIVAITLTDHPTGAANSGKTGKTSINLATTDQPIGPAAINLIVNDAGDASDTGVGDSICDTSPAAGDQCTLRAAIEETNTAAGDDMINFILPANSTITLNSALPDIIGNLAIHGPGANTLTVQRSTAGGTPRFRILRVDSGVNVAIQGMTITNGFTADGTGPIFVGDPGGGILNIGTLTLTNVTIHGNRTGNGSSVGSVVGGSGAGVCNFGTMTLLSSTVSANQTGGGGSGGSGAGILNAGTMTIVNTTVSGNQTSNGGDPPAGGDGGFGGGIYNSNSSTLTLTNSTVTNNSTGNGGSVSTGGSGGGIYNVFGTTNIKNTIVANNVVGAGGSGPDLSGTFNSYDYNLIENTTGSTFIGTTTHDITGQDPNLGSLANNGGPTDTRAPLPGSLAIDAGDNCVLNNSCSPPLTSAITTDQRGAGFSRVADGNGDATATVDIGAYEVQSILVTNTADSGAGSLRQAITDANVNAGTDAINFQPGLTGTITLDSVLPDLSTSLAINGPGVSLLTIQRSTAGGIPNFRIFKINSGVTVTISGLTMTNGKVTGTFPANNGGGIWNDHGTLTVKDSILSGNSASVISPAGFGGGIYNDGSSEGSGVLTIINSTISGNSAVGNGGGIFNNGFNGSAPLTIISSAITGNSAGGGGGIQSTGQGGNAPVRITNSTISGNSGANGGGINNDGTQGGDAPLTIVNSTISGNGATVGGGGIVNEGSGSSGATVTITNSTITNNRADTDNTSPSGFSDGGGMFIFSGTVILRNTILAGNFHGSVGTTPDDIFNADVDTTNSSFNLIGTGGSGGLTNGVNNNQVGVSNPGLGSLGNNGGPTQTHALLASSPALDAASNANLTLDTFDLDGDSNTNEAIPFDQRGAGFARIVDGPDADTTATVDIGAFEAKGFIRFTSANFNTTESSGSTTITVERVGDTSQSVTVSYAADDSSIAVVPCATANGIASSRCDFTTALGTLRFAAGESSKNFLVLISQDSYVEGPETLTLTLSNPTGGAVLATPSTTTLTIADDATEPTTNPIDDADKFVRQHYHDFLNRQPDAAGLAFWTNQITECQQPGATCNAEERRINVSAAFFVSIEFQETGYLVYRMYKAGYGNIPGTPVPLRLNEFLPDTQQIGHGVVVGVGNWETLLENNKVAFALDFVSRPRFTSAYPATLTPAEFVDALFAKAGVTPSTADRDAAINEFGGAVNTADAAARARALRRVAENSIFKQQEFNRAFVLMQYFGYLRRNPNDAPELGLNFDGYNFWLNKLNQFNGNYIAAEMVKAFITAGEYRQRFGS